MSLTGEGIYFAAKSGRMAAESIRKLMAGGSRLPTEQEIKDTYIKDYDKAYGPTYTVLDILQRVSLTYPHHTDDGSSTPADGRHACMMLLWTLQVFYSNNAAREAFVELCESEYVQKVTFDSYLYKRVSQPIIHLKPTSSPAAHHIPPPPHVNGPLTLPCPRRAPPSSPQVQGQNPVEDIKLLFKTIGALMRGNALAPRDKEFSNPVESLKRL